MVTDLALAFWTGGGQRVDLWRVELPDFALEVGHSGEGANAVDTAYIVMMISVQQTNGTAVPLRDNGVRAVDRRALQRLTVSLTQLKFKSIKR